MTPCSAAAQSPFSAAAIASTKLAPAAFNSAATVSSCLIQPFRSSDTKTLVPNVDPQLMHHALYSFEHLLGFIPAAFLNCFACRAHEINGTLGIMKHQFARFELADPIAVQLCGLHSKALG